VINPAVLHPQDAAGFIEQAMDGPHAPVLVPTRSQVRTCAGLGVRTDAQDVQIVRYRT
jgi:hypothetical protein